MNKPYIIAEIGFNHNGSVALAEKMIKSAAAAGVDAVKFQSFKAADLYLKTSEIYPLLESAELSVKEHEYLKKISDKEHVDFLSTPFSVEWVDILYQLGVKGFKIASMDLNNNLLLKSVAQKGKTVYLSTGLSDIPEISKSVELLKTNGAKEIIVLHCISNYPTRPEDVHLGFMHEIKDKLKTQVGFSDHSLGIMASLAAAVLGAEVIEKHFTIDKNLEGPDHKNSIDPTELKSLVEGINLISKFLLPNTPLDKRPDIGAKKMMRRGIYAAEDIRKGEIISLDKIKFVRPEVTPLEMLDNIVNKAATKDITSDEVVSL